MTARPFAGLRVVLVAAFNRRYHRSGLTLAAALAALGCEVRRCEERRRGWNSILARALAPRLAAELRPAPADAVLVLKGTALPPDAVAAPHARVRRRWAHWVPAAPHHLGASPPPA